MAGFSLGMASANLKMGLFDNLKMKKAPFPLL
jgi:hypothetical protein